MAPSRLNTLLAALESRPEAERPGADPTKRTFLEEADVALSSQVCYQALSVQNHGIRAGEPERKS